MGSRTREKVPKPLKKNNITMYFSTLVLVTILSLANTAPDKSLFQTVDLESARSELEEVSSEVAIVEEVEEAEEDEEVEEDSWLPMPNWPKWQELFFSPEGPVQSVLNYDFSFIITALYIIRDFFFSIESPLYVIFTYDYQNLFLRIAEGIAEQGRAIFAREVKRMGRAVFEDTKGFLNSEPLYKQMVEALIIQIGQYMEA